MFSDQELSVLGVKREELVNAYIERCCIQSAAAEVKNTRILFAFRHLCLALATYPRAALKTPLFYLTLLACATGPLGTFAARLAVKSRSKKQRERLPS
jgi:hypothetical protein